jgi:hypothetical protein
MTEEEVVIATAHDLVADGWAVRGLAGSEFVVEIPIAIRTDAVLERIGTIAHGAVVRVLGAVPCRLRLDFAND